MPPPYETILLDFDHTLLDSDTSEALAFESTLSGVGISDPSQHFSTYKTINTSLWARVEAGELSPNDVKVQRFAALLDDIGVDADPHAMGQQFVEGLAEFGELYPGAREILELLTDAATLAMITNGIGYVQRTRIDRLGLGSYFSAIVISGEFGASKPGSEIFEHTFDVLGRPDPEASIMVGDSLSSDIRGGAQYGIDTCWYNARRTAAPADADVSIEVADLAELSQLITS
ncbi:MAG: YjjG family noncanonical pyrimidine nucleotidase [Acidimicrobiales bacterium]